MMTDTERLTLAIQGLCGVCHALNRSLDALAQRVAALEQRALALPAYRIPYGPGPQYGVGDPPPGQTWQVTCANGAHNG